MVNAPDCGSGIRGFDSHQSPHIMGYGQVVKASDFDSDTGGSNPPSPAIDAGVAELADALDLGSSSSECRFDSCHPHHITLNGLIQKRITIRLMYQAFFSCKKGSLSYIPKSVELLKSVLRL